ncbi:SIR2 family protein [Caldimonas tepidiphila]|uniref:SIR2 family protein n=1 Tax=Caldimonas tepidiphila TaxID=2315841 RepID=UPI000E5BAF6C|nr:SIR2 family protein [Caldimonas tepidiphila]
MSDTASTLREIAARLQAGGVVPYLGPGLLAPLAHAGVPATPEALVALLTAKATVPHKIRKRLSAAAQYIESFKHRKSLVALMNEAFQRTPEPSALHRLVARSRAPLLVDTWYDDALLAAMAAERKASDWGQIQGLSQSEHFGTWHRAYDAAGAPAPSAGGWRTLVYKPLGSRFPAGNYLVSDSDHVEVLTEIDIQTPIPPEVQALRAGRSFLFLGCRFDDQLARSFARQIMKRSSDTHWAVLPGTPTRMEERFLREQGIRRIELPLADFAVALGAEARD